MRDDAVGLGNLLQGPAFMAVLPARPPSRRFARAACALLPWRLIEPIARWRLAAVGTVQDEPALKFRKLGFQRRDLGRLPRNLGGLRRHQRNQFFP